MSSPTVAWAFACLWRLACVGCNAGNLSRPEPPMGVTVDTFGDPASAPARWTASPECTAVDVLARL